MLATARRPMPMTLPLALLAILLVASLSVGYTGWTKRLNLGGLASTAKFSVEWITDEDLTYCVVISDSLHAAGAPTFFRDTDPSIMHFKVKNVYPGYVGSCTFGWLNSGMLPVQLAQLDVNGITVTSGQRREYDLTLDGYADLRIVLNGGGPLTANPGDTGSITISIRVLDNAPQETDLHFIGHARFTQAP
jgi:hypothetical protein